MIIQCRHCNSPVIKGMEAIRNYPVNVEFELKCPKCQNLLKIQLTYERIVIIDEEHKSSKLGPGGIRIINE